MSTSNTPTVLLCFLHPSLLSCFYLKPPRLCFSCIFLTPTYFTNHIPQLFAKYMLTRLNLRPNIFTYWLFWLSQGVYSEYTFGYPPKSGGKDKVRETLFPLGTSAPHSAPPLSNEKGQKLRNFNLPSNKCDPGPVCLSFSHAFSNPIQDLIDMSYF